MMAFGLGLQRQIETPMKMLSLLNDINVSPKENSPHAPVLDDAAMERLGRLPGVAAAYPNIRLRGIKVHYGGKTEGCLAVGIPREACFVGRGRGYPGGRPLLRQGQQQEAISAPRWPTRWASLRPKRRSARRLTRRGRRPVARQGQTVYLPAQRDGGHGGGRL